MLEIAEGRVLLCGPRLLARSSDSFCCLLLLVVVADRLVTGFLIPIIRVSGGERDGWGEANAPMARCKVIYCSAYRILGKCHIQQRKELGEKQRAEQNFFGYCAICIVGKTCSLYLALFSSIYRAYSPSQLLLALEN